MLEISSSLLLRAKSNILLPLVGLRIHWFRKSVSMSLIRDFACSCSLCVLLGVSLPFGQCSLGKLKSPKISISDFRCFISFVMFFTASNIYIHACFGQSGGRYIVVMIIL